MIRMILQQASELSGGHMIITDRGGVCRCLLGLSPTGAEYCGAFNHFIMSDKAEQDLNTQSRAREHLQTERVWEGLRGLASRVVNLFNPTHRWRGVMVCGLIGGSRG